MSQDPQLTASLTKLCQAANWQLKVVTTPTGLVVELENQRFAGIWWDFTKVNLDTTIATITLIRDRLLGPITIFTSKASTRVIQKLYQSKVDDIISPSFSFDQLLPLLNQRLWLYQQITPQSRQPANPSQPADNIIKLGQLVIDPAKIQVTKDKQPVFLTPKEFQLLLFLLKHRGQVLSREQLIQGVWGYDLLNTSRIVDIHISHLRDKLEDDSQHPTHLLTVRGFGYKFV